MAVPHCAVPPRPPLKTNSKYEGLSLMDGETPEHNMLENLSDFWSDSFESAEVEAAADDLIVGTTNARIRFGRAGGDPLELRVDIGLLRWLGFLFK